MPRHKQPGEEVGIRLSNRFTFNRTACFSFLEAGQM